MTAGCTGRPENCTQVGSLAPSGSGINGTQIQGTGNIDAGTSLGATQIGLHQVIAGCTYDSAPVPYYVTGSEVTAITKDNNLWFFGQGLFGQGLSAPPAFPLGRTTATLTALGGGTGSYTWTVMNGGDKVTFSNGQTTYTAPMLIQHLSKQFLTAWRRGM